MPSVGGKITSNYNIIGGLIAGCIISGGLLSWTIPGVFWLMASPIIIVFGVLLVLDDALPYGRQPHLGSEAGGFMAGIVIVILAFYTVLFPLVLVLAILAGIIRLAPKLLMGRWRKPYKTKAH